MIAAVEEEYHYLPGTIGEMQWVIVEETIAIEFSKFQSTCNKRNKRLKQELKKMRSIVGKLTNNDCKPPYKKQCPYNHK